MLQITRMVSMLANRLWHLKIIKSLVVWNFNLNGIYTPSPVAFLYSNVILNVEGPSDITSSLYILTSETTEKESNFIDFHIWNIKTFLQMRKIPERTKWAKRADGTTFEHEKKELFV